MVARELFFFLIFSEARMIRTFRSKRKFFTSRLLEDYI